VTLIAKPIIDKQYWILQDGSQKVGNIEACVGGYQVKINNQIAQFKTIRMAAQRVNIQFESVAKSNKPKTATNLVHGYPAKGQVYNPMWDLHQRLPIYAKTAKSKSWFAAGWYRVKQGKTWVTMQDPKLITIQRYPYQGPFHTRESAEQ
jgi:hypothetical protein